MYGMTEATTGLVAEVVEGVVAEVVAVCEIMQAIPTIAQEA